MNNLARDMQRQLLADYINDVSKRLARYDADIIKLENQLAKKRGMRDTLRKELSKLEEGVDW